MVLRTIDRTSHHLMADVESNQEAKHIAFLYRFEGVVEYIACIEILIEMLLNKKRNALSSRGNTNER